MHSGLECTPNRMGVNTAADWAPLSMAHTLIKSANTVVYVPLEQTLRQVLVLDHGQLEAVTCEAGEVVGVHSSAHALNYNCASKRGAWAKDGSLSIPLQVHAQQVAYTEVVPHPTDPEPHPDQFRLQHLRLRC